MSVNPGVAGGTDSVVEQIVGGDQFVLHSDREYIDTVAHAVDGQRHSVIYRVERCLIHRGLETVGEYIVEIYCVTVPCDGTTCWADALVVGYAVVAGAVQFPYRGEQDGVSGVGFNRVVHSNEEGVALVEPGGEGIMVLHHRAGGQGV